MAHIVESTLLSSGRTHRQRAIVHKCYGKTATNSRNHRKNLAEETVPHLLLVMLRQVSFAAKGTGGKW